MIVYKIEKEVDLSTIIIPTKSSEIEIVINKGKSFEPKNIISYKEFVNQFGQ